MDDATRNEVADCLEHLAQQEAWNSDLWQRCYDLVRANSDDDLMEYVYDDVIHYSGLFRARKIFGIRSACLFNIVGFVIAAMKYHAGN
jgi:hypothetical protein